MSYCGIDLGTTNSAVATTLGPTAKLLSIERGRSTVPSAIFFDFDENSVKCGRAAVESQLNETPGRFMRALKSLLGSSLLREKLRIKRRSMSYADIIAMFIRYLKHSAERELGYELQSAVIGRPVHFVDDDPNADRLAQGELEAILKREGFHNIAFQYEPIAAALQYEQTVRREDIAFIADIGGGTSDFSIVRISPRRARHSERQQDILANAGLHIGGGDFDRLLSLSKIMPHLGYRTRTRDGKRDLPNWCFVDLATWHRINFLSEPKILSRLREICQEAEYPALVQKFIYIIEHRLGFGLATAVEDAKIALADSTNTALCFKVGTEELTVPITQNDLIEAIRRSVDAIITTIHSTVRTAGLKESKISTVFLTGGSVLIPGLSRQIVGIFPEAKVVEGDLFGSVALGLALEAKKIFGEVKSLN